MGKISTVFFDVGGVLLVEFIDHKITDLADKYGKVEEIERMREAREQYRPLADCGLMEDRVFWEKILQAVGIKAEEEDLLCNKYFEEIPGAIPMAVNLKKRGFKIAILSNDSHGLSRLRRNRFGFDELFDTIVISCFHGVAKPDLSLYRIAVDKARVMPENCLFIDDLQKNVTAACQLGMQSILFENVVQLARELSKLGLTV